MKTDQDGEGATDDVLKVNRIHLVILTHGNAEKTDNVDPHYHHNLCAAMDGGYKLSGLRPTRRFFLYLALAKSGQGPGKIRTTTGVALLMKKTKMMMISCRC